MPTITPYAFASLAEVKASIKNLETSQTVDDRLVLLINGVTALFEQYTKRKLLQRTYKPTGAVSPEVNLLLHGDDRLDDHKFLLPQYPVSSVAAITLKQSDLLVGNQTVLVSGQDWTVDRETGVLTLIDGDTFPSGKNNVEIEWTGGYASTDADFDILKTATIEQVREYWYRENRAQDGVQSLSDPGGSVTYFTGALLPSVRLTLDYYVRGGIA